MRLFFFLSLFIIFQTGKAQQTNQKPDFRAPMDLPIFLSGTFGELRSDHFHSGIDIRTQSVEGHPVFAIEDGFVNRVAVSAVGFGKAVYLSHPKTGHISVYAHLQKFNFEIGDYVKSQQYKNESFPVNLFPESNLLSVKKGDLIGFAGNSGSSGGPHLHFEIRDAATQEVLNPLEFGFKTKDFIRPNINRLAVYPESNEARVNGRNVAAFLEVQGWGESHRIQDNAVVKAFGEVSFGITTYDTHNDTPNKNGVYSIELFIDSVKVFGFKANRFSFDETRYINSMIDYGFLVRNKSRIIRTKIDPLNKLSLYEGMKGSGTFFVEKDKKYNAVYIVSDFHGNISKLPFVITGELPKINGTSATNDSTGDSVEAKNEHRVKSLNYEAIFPAEAFYRDEKIVHKAEKNTRFLSDIITIGNNQIPVHKNYRLAIKPNSNVISTEKLLIVRIEKDNNLSAIGGKPEKGMLAANTRSLGDFAITADTTKPLIKALNFKNGSIADTLKSLRIEISDDLSGIESIKPSLNGKWLLMDYDAKNKLLIYEIDERLIIGENIFKLIVTDKCNNLTSFEAIIKKTK
jgi:murein DD-endopeptidase MepM/ murein hydrolase activator NlpD